MFNNYHKFYLSLVLLWAAIKSSCRDDLQIARNPDGVLSPPSSCPFSIFSQFHIFLSWFLFPTGYIYKSDESRWDSSPLFSINFNPTMPVSVLCSRLNPYFLLPFICIAGFTNYRIPWESCISWLTKSHSFKPTLNFHSHFISSLPSNCNTKRLSTLSISGHQFIQYKELCCPEDVFGQKEIPTQRDQPPRNRQNSHPRNWEADEKHPRLKKTLGRTDARVGGGPLGKLLSCQKHLITRYILNILRGRGAFVFLFPRMNFIQIFIWNFLPPFSRIWILYYHRQGRACLSIYLSVVSCWHICPFYTQQTNSFFHVTTILVVFLLLSKCAFSLFLCV